MARDLKFTRNIGIMAHIDAGKTTTSERILYYTGKTHKLGEVHEGGATMDWMVQEQERGITITSAATTAFWNYNGNQYQINLIDTPGHVDFTVEVERSLRVLDGTVATFCAVGRVQPQSETVWRQADKYGVPRICFINKINQIGGDFYKSLESIHKRLSKNAYAIHLPIGFEKDICGVVDLIDMKAYTYKDYADHELVVGEIPADMVEKAKHYRSMLVEEAVQADEALMEKFFEEGDEVPCLENVCAVGPHGEPTDCLKPGAAPVVVEAAAVEAAPAAAEAAPAAEAVIVAGAPVSPRAAKLAKAHGVDATQAVGTGPNGRIIERDVQKLIAQGRKDGMIRAADLNAQLEKLAADGTIAKLAEKYDVVNTTITDFSDVLSIGSETCGSLQLSS